MLVEVSQYFDGSAFLGSSITLSLQIDPIGSSFVAESSSSFAFAGPILT